MSEDRDAKLAEAAKRHGKAFRVNVKVERQTKPGWVLLEILRVQAETQPANVTKIRTKKGD